MEALKMLKEFLNSNEMIRNKYYRWYLNIITTAKCRDQIEGYVETHHVLPKSCGGSNDEDNLVVLTYREHFVAHWLLVKFTEGKQRAAMYNALWMMSNGAEQRRRNVTSRYYDISTRARIERYKTVRGENHHMYGKKRPDHSQAMKGRYIGRTLGEDTKQKIADTWHDTHKSIECVHCGKIVSIHMHTRWHGDNCKLVSSVARDEMSKKMTNKVLKMATCIHCGAVRTTLGIKRYHNENCPILDPARSAEYLLLQELDEPCDPCVHCGYNGMSRDIKRHHNDNCRMNPANRSPTMFDVEDMFPAYDSADVASLPVSIRFRCEEVA